MSRTSGHAVDVYYTVDTEIWWSAADLSRFDEDFARHFDGRTAGLLGHGRERGVGHQLDLLDRHGLKGVFFVEPLFACAVGLDPLRRMVDRIQSRGHDVQLHLHTEWLQRMREPLLGPGRFGEHLHQFSEDEQVRLLQRALRNLTDAGAEGVCAFRAGNFGASLATLRALARVGIKYDSSYNFCYLGEACRMAAPGDQPIVQPRWIEGVVELPVSCLEDWPGHYRHVQLRAISFAEMKRVLLQAHRLRWRSVVIVSHSFELLNSARTGPDPIVGRRLARLCSFLEAHRDRFRSAVFDGSYEPPPGPPPGPPPDPPRAGRGVARHPVPRGLLRQTGWRLGEQLARRLLFER